MKALLKNSLSDYLWVEIVAVVLAAVIVGAVTAYVSADSIYKASIIGGSITPIMGAPGQLSGQGEEKAPSYYAQRYMEIKERITGIFGSLVWSNSGLLSSVFGIAAMVALFPFVYRLRTSFVPLLFRERSGPIKLGLTGLLLALLLLLPLFLSASFPLVLVARNWLSGVSLSSVILLNGILWALLLMLSVSIYSTYILWGRLDLSLVFTLLLAFGLSGKLSFAWKTVWIYLATSVGLVVVMVVVLQRRLMSV
ncbi:hypothetical protein [Thermococcus waiotapuensis]|uniref:Uncharacterized protein n=1 Tax=Thermococcus waiotapuensis TaxID=90909 RepID=A0AAE4NV78_9EURY|nr:hypothetical protein [Thermococcus waiotapuensis]MDV3103277.1 hypothetical protein [Thermococcus waiotapuensis]